MIIRKAKASDLEKLLSLYEHLHDDDIAVSKNLLESVWQKIINSDSFIYFVIDQDDLLVSTCNLTVIPNLTRGGQSIGLLENVVTHREYRNKGLGKLIIEAAVDFAKSSNCYKVMLLSSSKRKEAHKFYEALGFSSTDKIGFSKKLR
jgi:N-acetylglutamate synthase-like GNAT family acetyltransferase